MERTTKINNSALEDITARPIQDLVPASQTEEVYQLLNGSDMKPGATLASNHRTRLVHMSGGSIVDTETGVETPLIEGGRLPAVVTEVDPMIVQGIGDGIKKIAVLDRLMKKGFAGMFADNEGRARASEYLRFIFNVTKDQDPYVEELVRTFSDNPALCEEYPHSYRGDGRIFADGRPGFNELNSVPGGASWMPRLANFCLEKGLVKDTHGLTELYPGLSEYVLRRNDGRGVFFPTFDLLKFKVLGESIIWMRDLEKAGVNAFLGELATLDVDDEVTTRVKTSDESVEIGYIDGLSNPETLRSRLDILNAIRIGKITCPTMGDIVGLSNKGMFVLVTAIKEGRFNLEDFGISHNKLAALSDSIPATHWLSEQGKDPHNIDQLLSGEFIFKPFNLVGGAGFISHPDRQTVDTLTESNQLQSYIAQARLEEFPVAITTQRGTIVHSSSIDPYYRIAPDGTPIVSGLISRGSSEGVSNVSAHVKDEAEQLVNHIGVVVAK